MLAGRNEGPERGGAARPRPFPFESAPKYRRQSAETELGSFRYSAYSSSMNPTLRLFVRSSSGFCLVKFNMFVRHGLAAKFASAAVIFTDAAHGRNCIRGLLGGEGKLCGRNLSRFVEVGIRRAHSHRSQPQPRWRPNALPRAV